jgi:phosphohistidine phosphatase
VTRLLLIRHAKAQQDAATDEARELSGRGRRDARAAGGWLAANGYVPDHVVVSSAVRAAQTWDAVAAAIATTPPVVDVRIYDNTVEALLEVLADVPLDATAVALVGHSPSMHALALLLDDGRGDVAARAMLSTSYPTMGIAVFEVEPGAPPTPGTARLLAFEAPRSSA